MADPYAAVSIPNEDLPNLDDECTRLRRDASPDTLAGIKKIPISLGLCSKTPPWHPVKGPMTYRAEAVEPLT